MQGMGAKTLDVNRILGNLIDNAFDEVLKYDEGRRQVTLIGTQDEHSLEFVISNTCDNASQVAAEPLFEAGYSTKHKKEFQGLGLSIVKEVAVQYKGEVRVIAEAPDKIAFIVKIPL